MDYDKDILEYLQSHPEETKFSETLELVVKSIPGAMEKLKSIDSELGKFFYYGELCKIASELDDMREGKVEPN